MIHPEITESIIGAAMTVLNELKPGLDEKIYERALAIEVRSRGHVVVQQRRFDVHYRGELIGTLVPDLIVDGKAIADPKVVASFNESHVAQMIGYLSLTGLEVAVLLSFKDARLHWKRVIREKRNLTADVADSADERQN
jgi:GxxExxY protein